MITFFFLPLMLTNNNNLLTIHKSYVDPLAMVHSDTHAHLFHNICRTLLLIIHWVRVLCQCGKLTIVLYVPPGAQFNGITSCAVSFEPDDVVSLIENGPLIGPPFRHQYAPHSCLICFHWLDCPYDTQTKCALADTKKHMH